MQIVAELKINKIRQIGVGQGLNSIVYLAYDHQLDTQLALKEIDKNTFWNPDCFAEAKAVLSVAHPNVVSVQYGCEKGSDAYVAMPYYSNGSLADRLSSGPLPLSEFSRVGQGILQGLAHIHVKRYFHLDLKPSNILFGNDLRPLVSDFGQARRIGAGGLVSAPPLYRKTMPPEVLKTNLAVVQSDIYQAGVLFYRALNGEQLFAAQLARFVTVDELKEAILKGKFPDRQRFLPHVPKQLRSLVRKAMRIDPGDRFDAATTFADALGRINIHRDWSVQIHPSGEMTWTGTSGCTASLTVELKSLKNGWNTEVYTNGAILRAKDRAGLWKPFQTREEALDHLKWVFERL